jgi:hypothetical protein
MAARAEQQRELLRQHPEMPAWQLMALSSGGNDDRLDRAGRTFDELMAAHLRGVAGVMHRFNPTQRG